MAKTKQNIHEPFNSTWKIRTQLVFLFYSYLKIHSVFGSHAYQPPQRSLLGGDDGGGTGRVVHERQLPEAAFIVILTHACSWYHNVIHSPAGRGQTEAGGGWGGQQRGQTHRKLQQDQKAQTSAQWGPELKHLRVRSSVSWWACLRFVCERVFQQIFPCCRCEDYLWKVIENVFI